MLDYIEGVGQVLGYYTNELTFFVATRKPSVIFRMTG